VGGTAELIAAEDRARVLCPPTADELAAALAQALAGDAMPRPARPAHAPEESLAAWLELVENIEPAHRAATVTPAKVTVVVSGDESFGRANTLARVTQSVDVEVIKTTSRRQGLDRATAEWVVFLDDEDAPDAELLDTFAAAQAAADADVVTCAVRPVHDAETVQAFLGDPGALGLVENQYGVLGLVRRSLAAAQSSVDGAVDPDWLLFARLALGGARIVSIPEAVSAHSGRPGAARDVPGEGPAVLEAFETHDGAPLHDLPQLSATLAAALARIDAQPTASVAARGFPRRALGALRRVRPQKH
jgi:hypothetical protein